MYQAKHFFRVRLGRLSQVLSFETMQKMIHALTGRRLECKSFRAAKLLR